VAQEQSNNAGPDCQGLSLVVAMARNGTIGIEDRLPWKLRSDLMRFKRLTMGNTLLMGRKTYESIGRLLPGRKTIILTRQKEYRIEGASIVHSLEHACKQTPAGQRLYVVGGAEIYRLCMPWVNQIHLTRVLADIPGDTVFNELDLRGFSLLESEFVPCDSVNDWPSRYELYERRKNID
jgi:dihydrofolate reductase